MKIKGLKKAASEAKSIPAGYHQQVVYNYKRHEITHILPELLTETWAHMDDILDNGETLINIFPKQKMSEIAEAIEWYEQTHLDGALIEW